MDLSHKDMQFHGAFEIFKETFKIINKNTKIFSMAALCFIHPLNYMLSGFMETLNDLLRNLHEYGNMSHLFSHNWSLFWPFQVFCITFLFGCSILSTAGVSQTVVALYSGREPSVKDTMSVVVKVWKRVLVTFLCVGLVFLAYHIIAGFGLFLIVWPFGKVDGTTLAMFLILYLIGLLYLIIIFQLAGVVSALEESCGFQAMAKSRLLLKGKMVSAVVVVSAIYSSFGILLWLKYHVKMMLFSPSLVIWMYVSANLSLLLLILVFLLWRLVLETMFYFVCKSYHQESIDVLAFSDKQLVPLRSSKC
ncbi:uncharacterized protein LOC111797044 [Cucurbita pepo subsp. pepo]|uniref:uncharacterized protein LOC111797044 n=1 Tax=Cucurbita pepo subsp. pepo TaxID=3664 RepID=UPI000C9D65ED|nr:uncharacterized protein LOC111797044 [Cucurbita pepo subsp. pepo]